MSIFDDITADLSISLEQYFPSTAPIRSDLNGDGIADTTTSLDGGLVLRATATDPVVEGMSFIWSGTDSVGIHGLAPSYRPVTIRGFIVRVPGQGGDDDAYHRYIDWLDVYAQMGQTMHSRTPIPPPAG